LHSFVVTNDIVVVLGVEVDSLIGTSSTFSLISCIYKEIVELLKIQPKYETTFISKLIILNVTNEIIKKLK